MLRWFKLFEIVSDRKGFMDSGVLSSETTTICLWIQASSHVFIHVIVTEILCRI